MSLPNCSSATLSIFCRLPATISTLPISTLPISSVSRSSSPEATSRRCAAPPTLMDTKRSEGVHPDRYLPAPTHKQSHPGPNGLNAAPMIRYGARGAGVVKHSEDAWDDLLATLSRSAKKAKVAIKRTRSSVKKTLSKVSRTLKRAGGVKKKRVRRVVSLSSSPKRRKAGVRRGAKAGVRRASSSSSSSSSASGGSVFRSPMLMKMIGSLPAEVAGAIAPNPRYRKRVGAARKKAGAARKKVGAARVSRSRSRSRSVSPLAALGALLASPLSSPRKKRVVKKKRVAGKARNLKRGYPAEVGAIGYRRPVAPRKKKAGAAKRKKSV